MPRRALLVAALLLATAVPVRAELTGSVPLKTFLHGKVESMKGRRVVIVYDFKSHLQLLDFEPVNPFLLQTKGAWRIEEGKLVVSGTGAFKWKPVCSPDIRIRHRMAPKDGRDAGVVLVEPQLTSRCILFAVADTFFSTKDRQKTLAHMITCCGVPEPGSSRENVFRYVDRAWDPVVLPQQEILVEVQKVAERNRMVLKDKVLEGRDVGIRLPKLQAALCVIGAGAAWSELRIEALLDDAWLRANDILWDPGEDAGGAEEEKPAPPREDLPPTSVDQEIKQVREWLQKIGDVTAPMRDREAAAEKIVERNRLMDVPTIVRSGLLYSGDENTRRMASDLLKAITGKTLGYHPRMDAEKRKTAVSRWWAWITANRGRIDKDEEKGGDR